MRLLRHLLFLLNCVAALLLGLSTLAGSVSPSRTILFSLLSYAYVPLLAVNVVFIVLWALWGKLYCLLSAAVIVLRWSFIPLFFQLGGNSEPPANAEGNLLKVMTFNVHNFSGRDESMPRAEGAAAFIALVRQEQPDVLCLQEYYSNRKVYSVSDTLAALGYRHSRGFGKNHSGVRLFSRYAIRGSGNLGEGNKFYADIRKDGADVRLVCVHLASYHLGSKDLAIVENAVHGQVDDRTMGVVGKFKNAVRKHEQEWNKALKPVVENHKGHLLLMGDCNDTPASYFYHQATRTLRDTYCEQGQGLATTYHGPFPAFRIDHILHSDGMEALSYKCVKSDISDHYPLVAVFRLP